MSVQHFLVIATDQTQLHSAVSQSIYPASPCVLTQPCIITQVNAIMFTWLDDPFLQPDLLFCRGHVGHLMKYDDRCNRQQWTQYTNTWYHWCYRCATARVVV